MELRSRALRHRARRELGPRAVEVGGAADRADADETPAARVAKGEAALVLVGLERLVVPGAAEAHVLERQPVGEVGPEVGNVAERLVAAVEQVARGEPALGGGDLLALDPHRPAVQRAVSIGVAFGMLFQTPALAIVLYFVVPIIGELATGLVPALQGVGGWINQSDAMTPLLENHMGATGWAKLATTLAFWLVLPLTLGVIRLLRREVK